MFIIDRSVWKELFLCFIFQLLLPNMSLKYPHKHTINSTKGNLYKPHGFYPEHELLLVLSFIYQAHFYAQLKHNNNKFVHNLINSDICLQIQTVQSVANPGKGNLWNCYCHITKLFTYGRSKDTMIFYIIYNHLLHQIYWLPHKMVWFFDRTLLNIF